MYVCVCDEVTDTKVRDIIKRFKCKTVEDIQKHIDIGMNCGYCITHVKRMLDEENGNE